MNFPEHAWIVKIEADAVDSFASMVWEISLTRTSDAPQQLSLGSWAISIAEHVTGLLERLTVHEVDESHQVALLRSESPTGTGDSVNYYEVRLNGMSSATILRYVASKQNCHRQQQPYALTHEVLAKLIADIAR